MERTTESGGVRAPRRLVRARDLPEVTPFKLSFWEKRRQRGTGPPWMKYGSAVIYDLDVVMAWIEARAERHGDA